jgi:hypothetical protein
MHRNERRNLNKIKFRTMLFLAFFAIQAFVLSNTIAATKQFLVEGEIAFGWPAQDSTVDQIFANQSVPNSTTVYVWNVQSQSWDTTRFDDIDNAWLPSNLTVQSGRGFILAYQGQGGHTYTFNYTPRTNGTLSIVLDANKWHYLSYGWNFNPSGDPGDGMFALEMGWGQYAGGKHLYWPGGCCPDNVLMYIWVSGGQLFGQEFHRWDECTRKWNNVSYLPPPLWDFWLQPMFFYNDCETRTWVQSSTVGGN